MPARALLAAALLGLATAANAVPIGAVGDSFAVSFDGNVEASPVPGLSASATFLVTELDALAGRVVLEITLTNTSDASLWQSARASAIGFDVDGEIASASASGLFAHAVSPGRFPNQLGPVDVCAVDNRNNCSGGGSGGVHLGQSGVVTLTLQLAGPISSLELDNFGVRYQSLSSHDLAICEGSGTGGGTVPEPPVLGMLGLAGLALFGRRRR